MCEYDYGDTLMNIEATLHQIEERLRKIEERLPADDEQDTAPSGVASDYADSAE